MSGDRLSSDSNQIDVRSGPDAVLLFDDPCAQQRVVQLERQVAQLREGLVTREQIGLATGLVAERLGLSPDNAFLVLRAASQNRNVKLREVARIVLEARSGRLAETDCRLADELLYLIFGQCDWPAGNLPSRP